MLSYVLPVSQALPVGCSPRRDIFFDPAAAASLYSQLAGVLAGVVFAGLVFILTRAEAEGDTDIDRTLHCLFVVLFALLITSFVYATMSGELCTNRAEGEAVVASAMIASSVMLSWLGLGSLLKSYTALRDVLRTGQVTFGGLIFLSLVLVATVTDDAARTVTGSSMTRQAALTVPVGLMMIGALSGGILRLMRGRMPSHLLFRTLMISTVIHLVLLTAFFALLSGNTDLTQGALLPTWMVWLALIPLGILAGMGALCFPSPSSSRDGPAPEAAAATLPRRS